MGILSWLGIKEKTPPKEKDLFWLVTTNSGSKYTVRRENGKWYIYRDKDPKVPGSITYKSRIYYFGAMKAEDVKTPAEIMNEGIRFQDTGGTGVIETSKVRRVQAIPQN